jgi:hypothetical protein
MAPNAGCSYRLAKRGRIQAVQAVISTPKDHTKRQLDTQHENRADFSRLSACCRELQRVWPSGTAVAVPSYDPYVLNNQSKSCPQALQTLAT